MSVKILKALRLSALLIPTFAILSDALAADYYVDYADGADENTGASQTIAWKHCPGDPSATGNAVRSLAPGDNVFFKGGVTYILTSKQRYSVFGTPGINVTNSGTATDPITYNGNSEGTWGAGKALITDSHGTNEHIAFFFPFGQGSNVVIRNFDIGNIGGSAVLPVDKGVVLPPNKGLGILAEVGFRNVTIADCYLHELGYWQNVKPSGNSAISGAGIIACGASSGQAYETDGLTITNCVLTKMRNPIAILCFKKNLNIEIVGCKIGEYTEWCMDLAYVGNGGYWDNMSIHDNIFENYDVYFGTTYWKGYQEAPHQNGIYWRADVASNIPSTNVNFYNNTFRATVGEYSGGTSGLYLEGPAQANIYNNVFQNIYPANACIVLQMYALDMNATPQVGLTTNMLANIFNNTFYGKSTQIYFAGGAHWPTSNIINITNNLFISTRTTGVGNAWLYLFDVQNNFSQVATQSLRIDYNNYLTPNDSAYPKPAGTLIGNKNGSYIFFKDLGWDAHGSIKNPLFIAANDLRLQPSSSIIGTGANLTSLGLPSLSKDKDGKPRPATGPWSVGAYEGITPEMGPFISLEASSTTVTRGQSTTLTWSSVNATNVNLTGFGQMPPNGSINVSPTERTTYTAIASGSNGVRSASVSILTPAPPNRLRLPSN